MEPLATYVEKIYFEGQDPLGKNHRPFNNGTASNPPLLRRPGVNRILLYPGSFNPPHQGHRELLEYVFHNAGADLHICAAIIIPTNDERLDLKYRGQTDALIFSYQERVDLWRGKGVPVDWAWVFDSHKPWHEFRGKLEEELRKNGFDIRFILLGGPDMYSVHEICNPSYWSCPDEITSDVSRPVDFRNPDLTMKRLPGCSQWQPLHINYLRLERQHRARMRGIPEAEIKQAFKIAVDRLRTAFICRRQPSAFIRFLPINLESQPKEAPSSTRIREIIDTSPQEDLGSELAPVALNPGLLVEFVRKRKEKPTPDESTMKESTPEKPTLGGVTEVKEK